MKSFFSHITACFALTFVIVGAFGIGLLTTTHRELLNAQVLPLVPYGGQILLEIPCVCGTVGVWRMIGPPRPGPFIMVQGSMSYIWHMHAVPMTWVKGNATPGGVCLTLAACIPAPGGFVVGEGTGLVPGAPGI